MKWVVFDADNTLWHVEHLYDAARVQLAEELARLGIDPHEATEFQQQRDRELYQELGYSCERFPRSFQETLLHYFPNSNPDDVDRMRRIAENVFRLPAEPVAGLASILDQLALLYKLAIITAGEPWVQQSRLASFSALSRFDSTLVVRKKTQQTYEEFCEAENVDKTHSWAVGDSIRSDVIPASQARLNCILVDTHNWSRVERHDLEVPVGTRVVNELREIVPILTSRGFKV